MSVPIVLGMDHPRWCRGVAGGNPWNPENPERQDTRINMPISTHSSVTNLLHSSAYRSAPTQTPTKALQTLLRICSIRITSQPYLHVIEYICEACARLGNICATRVNQSDGGTIGPK